MDGKKIPGELIAKAEPYVHVLAYKQIDERCSYCVLRCENLKKCAACGLVKYCGKKCQKSDWSIHKTECPCYKHLQPKIPTDSVRLLLRIVIRHLKSEDEKLTDNDPGWRCFSELESHCLDVQRDEKRLQLFSQMMFTLNELVGDLLTLPPSHLLFSMFGKMVINTFSICDDDLQPIGSAIYTSPSKFDHSCDPNAVAVFSGKTLYVRALKEISEATPETVFLSYIDQMKPSAERIEELEEQYYFTCECSRCQDREIDELMYSVKCPVEKCTGYLGIQEDDAFKPCTQCNQLGSDSSYMSKALKTIETVDDLIVDIEKRKKTGELEPREILSMCEECFKTHDILSEFNVYRARFLDLAFDACINLEKWQDALEFGLQSLVPFRKHYPRNTPNLSLQLLKVGKIQVYLEKNQDALKTLQEAEDSLLISHSKDHSLYHTVSQLLLQCKLSHLNKFME